MTCCKNCGMELEWIDCPDCEEGFSYHDCGEDTCSCLNPIPNVECDTCDGQGGWWEHVEKKKCVKAEPSDEDD